MMYDELTIIDWEVQADLLMKSSVDDLQRIRYEAKCEIVRRETNSRLFDMDNFCVCPDCREKECAHFMSWRKMSTGEWIFLCQMCAENFDEEREEEEL